MGGLLIADAARDIVKNTRNGDPLWPNVVGIVGELLHPQNRDRRRLMVSIAFDTPVSSCRVPYSNQLMISQVSGSTSCKPPSYSYTRHADLISL
jgi:hypothetical protein